MTEKRKKNCSILLTLPSKNEEKTEGNILSIGLSCASQWPEKGGVAGAFRVKINGKWHCPAGKYTFLSFTGVGQLVGSLIGGDATAMPPRPYLPAGSRVQAFTGEMLAGVRLMEQTHTCCPAFPGLDGRWYTFVYLVEGGHKQIAMDDLTVIRLARERGKD